MKRAALAIAVALTLATPAVASAFQSPTGNIGCVITSGGVRCDIRERQWRPPPKPRSCQLDYGQGLSVGRSGSGRFVCAGDTALMNGRKVAYGTLVRRGRYACRVRTSGVTCSNTRTRHGFAISRQGYRRF